MQMSAMGIHKDLEFLLGMEDLMQLSFRPKINISENYLEELLDYQKTPREIWHIEWPFRLDSSTSKDKRLHPTFVLHKLCWLTWQRCTQFIMVLQD